MYAILDTATETVAKFEIMNLVGSILDKATQTVAEFIELTSNRTQNPQKEIRKSKLKPLKCNCILGEDPLCEFTRSIALELGLIKTKITTQTVADEQVMKPPPTQRGGESFIRESERRIATPRRRGRPRKEVPPPQKSTLERYLSVKPSMKVEALTIAQPTKRKHAAQKSKLENFGLIVVPMSSVQTSLAEEKKQNS